MISCWGSWPNAGGACKPVLNSEYLPASGISRQHLVLLHGWGCNREIWRPLLAAVRPWASVTLLDIPGCAPGAGEAADLDHVTLAMLEVVPKQAVYVGWSLGGQLAMAMAERHPDAVSAVVTLCSNPNFLAGDDWPGMDPAEFSAFRTLYARNADAALNRFDSLQVRGTGRSRQLLRRLRSLRDHRDGQGLFAGLDWLQCLDQRAQLVAPGAPRLHLFAAEDELVPVACAHRVAELVAERPATEVAMLDGVGHVAPLEAPQLLAPRLQGFLKGAGLLDDHLPLPAQLAKQDVAKSFSRAASEYDSVARLQQDVGSRLLTALDSLPQAPGRILDLGCGTGYFYPALKHRFPQAEYVGLDLAEGMVEFARQRFSREGRWVVGDAEALPLVAGSVDLVFSSLAVQWCYRPELLFAELSRVLRPGGHCVFTSLGPATLQELRAAWAAVDEHQHVNSFLPPAELAEAVARFPGLELAMKTEQFCMRYQRVRDLLNELKTLGAHNVNRGRPAGLTGRRALQGMLDAYECWREEGTLPATYDVLFGTLEKR